MSQKAVYILYHMHIRCPRKQYIYCTTCIIRCPRKYVYIILPAGNQINISKYHTRGHFCKNRFSIYNTSVYRRGRGTRSSAGNRSYNDNHDI